MITKIKLNNIPFLKKWFVTIGNTIYVPIKYYNLCKTIPLFRQNNLPLFEHENLHSKRQFKLGVSKWLWKYITDKDFKWQEEKLAYTLEISLKRKMKYKINKEWYFNTLNKYRMANKNQITEFLESV